LGGLAGLDRLGELGSGGGSETRLANERQNADINIKGKNGRLSPFRGTLEPFYFTEETPFGKAGRRFPAATSKTVDEETRNRRRRNANGRRRRKGEMRRLGKMVKNGDASKRATR